MKSAAARPSTKTTRYEYSAGGGSGDGVRGKLGPAGRERAKSAAVQCATRSCSPLNICARVSVGATVKERGFRRAFNAQIQTRESGDSGRTAQCGGTRTCLQKLPSARLDFGGEHVHLRDPNLGSGRERVDAHVQVADEEEGDGRGQSSRGRDHLGGDSRVDQLLGGQRVARQGGRACTGGFEKGPGLAMMGAEDARLERRRRRRGSSPACAEPAAPLERRACR
eukprot:scaffold2495_cov101-Isochrysis_galbana.AAC.11